VKRTALLLLLILVAPAQAAPFTAERTLDQQLVSEVVGAALDFMAPRTLEAIPVPQTALWGLRGLTALDPRLTVSLQGADKAATLRLTGRVPGPAERELLARPAPAATDAYGWGDAVAEAIRAAWDASEPVRRAGTEGVIRSFFDELLNHLDPYSRYIPPTDAEADRARRSGRAGVGLLVAPRGGGFVVQEVQAGGPAAQAGVRAGDRILAVDGQTTQGADLPSVATLLAGPDNTRVALTLRGRDNRDRTVVLERVRIPPETVTLTRDGHLLLLRVSSFSRDTGSRLAQQLIRGLSDPVPPRGVVIDLRGNRGGVLQQAVAAAAMLQAHGVVAVTAGRDPEAAHVFTADGRDLARFLPVVVLVDGGSASAAEILAAALADQRRAVVVGSSTLGKGLVQTILPLPDGGELLITWSRVLAPLGWPIQALGVLPQVCTSLGQEAIDRQLAALAHGQQPMAAALARERAARAPISPAEALAIRAACPAADGWDADLAAARFLVDTPDAYAAALLPRAAGDTVPQALTPNPAVGN
jgi:carboxyl-terminal processing protease